MNAWIKHEYLRLRAKNWSAKDAIRAARIKDSFEDAENEELVKLELEPEFEPHDVSYIDTWDDVSKGRKERLKKEVSDRIDRDGLWILVGYVKIDGRWESIDSIGDLIGTDWKDSGYDSDIMKSCLDALDDDRETKAKELADRATFAAG